MAKFKYDLSGQTRQRYWLVWLLILAGLAVVFSSIYFLFFPVGYQGGRNPYYNTVILFDRAEWDLIHLWSGIIMIIVLLVHIPVHWKWIKAMYQRCFKREVCNVGRLNWRAQMNIILDAVALISFLFAAASGIYLMITPNGRFASSSPAFIFTYRIWDVIHTWSGTIMIIASLFHFMIHWNWVTNVSARAFKRERISAEA